MKVALYKMEDAVFGPPSDVPAGNVTWGAAVPADGSVDESNALANAPDSSGLLAAPGAAELAAFARANAFQSAIDAIEHPTLSGALGTEFAKMAPMMRSGARLFESAPYIAVAPVLLPEMFAAAPAAWAAGSELAGNAWYGTGAYLSSNLGEQFVTVGATLGALGGTTEELDDAFEGFYTEQEAALLKYHLKLAHLASESWDHFKEARKEAQSESGG